MKVETAYFFSPVGWLKLSANNSGIKQIWFSAEPESAEDFPITNKHLKQGITQLSEYFNNQRTSFDVALNPDGTHFQQQVWEMLLKIPFGETTTYGELAREMGNPKAMRAVGRANGTNKIPIIIPCHRVIGLNGSLTGFAGGLERKQWLLNHERKKKQLELF
jgi:methylated-DNA-[protein]-cysteine S-methyltransferase